MKITVQVALLATLLASLAACDDAPKAKAESTAKAESKTPASAKPAATAAATAAAKPTASAKDDSGW